MNDELMELISGDPKTVELLNKERQSHGREVRELLRIRDILNKDIEELEALLNGARKQLIKIRWLL